MSADCRAEIDDLRKRVDKLDRFRFTLTVVGAAVAVALAIVFGVEPRQAAREAVKQEVANLLKPETIVAINNAARDAEDAARRAKGGADAVAALLRDAQAAGFKSVGLVSKELVVFHGVPRGAPEWIESKGPNKDPQPIAGVTPPAGGAFFVAWCVPIDFLTNMHECFNYLEAIPADDGSGVKIDLRHNVPDPKAPGINVDGGRPGKATVRVYALSRR